MRSPRHLDRELAPRLRPPIDIPPGAIPAIETEMFLRDHLPRPASLLEVGAGEGHLTARLRAAGWNVTAIDRSADAVAAARSEGIDITRAEFLGFEGGPYDIVLFSRVLHHIQPLERAVEHAASLLSPSGLVVAEEFAWERMDLVTAEWHEQRMIEFRDRAWSNTSPADLGTADPLGRWKRHHQEIHHVHGGDDLARALERRFDVVHSERAAYLYRYLCADLLDTESAVEAALALVSSEEFSINIGAIQPIGFRLIGRMA
jgi:SAM-dependent methyltransferase